MELDDYKSVFDKPYKKTQNQDESKNHTLPNVCHVPSDYRILHNVSTRLMGCEMEYSP